MSGDQNMVKRQQKHPGRLKKLHLHWTAPLLGMYALTPVHVLAAPLDSSGVDLQRAMRGIRFSCLFLL